MARVILMPSLPEHERRLLTSVCWNHLPAGIALRHRGVEARWVFAIPILGIRSLAVVAFVWIRVIRPAQGAAPPQPTEGRGQNDATVETMVMEPLAVKLAVRKSVRMKLAAVKPAMGKSSKSPMKSTRRATECAAVKSAGPAGEPAAMEALATVTSTAAMAFSAMRSRAGGTGLEECSRQEQCS